MKIALGNYFFAHHRSKSGPLLWLQLGLVALCSLGGGCSTSSRQASKIPVKDRSLVVLYLEAKRENAPITAVYCQDIEHKTGNRPMKLVKYGKGVACWMDNVPPGSFLVCGVDCTFLGNQELMPVQTDTFVTGPRSVVTTQGRYVIAVTTVCEPAVYYLGSYRVDPGQVRKGGRLYAAAQATELSEPPELSVLLKLAEKTEAGQGQNLVTQRIGQIRTYQKSKAAEK